MKRLEVRKKSCKSFESPGREAGRMHAGRSCQICHALLKKRFLIVPSTDSIYSHRYQVVNSDWRL